MENEEAKEKKEEEREEREGRKSAVEHVQIDSLCSHLSASLSVGFGSKPMAMTNGWRRRERNREDRVESRLVRSRYVPPSTLFRSIEPD